MLTVTGDIINIISPSLEDEGSKQPILISFKDPKSFIIHHPDIMLTMTSIANAMPCPRKPILQSLIRMPGPASKPMLYGNILHGLLQGALQEQNFGIDETRRRLNDELRKESIKLDVWGTGLGLDDVRQEVGGKAGLGFEKFGQKWIGSTPKVSYQGGRDLNEADL
jgi:DNA replication ATP-dependent helicase Dna2